MKLSKIASDVCPSPTLTMAARVAAQREQGIDVIDFSAGEPDFNTPECVKKAAIQAIEDNFTHYTPYAGITELRSAFAQYLKKYSLEYDAMQIVVSNGSKHALKNAFAAILDRDDEVIVPAPYWNSYIDIIKMCGGVPKVVKTKRSNGFRITVGELNDALTDKTKALLINSPNNPTGMVYSADELLEIGKFAVKNDLFIVSDEIYSRLIYSKKLLHCSIASLGEDIKKRTIVVGGLSKSYAMTGWRVGFTASDRDVATAIANIQSNSTSNVNSIAQKAAVAALTLAEDDAEAMLKQFEHRRDYIAQRISDIPFLSNLLPKGAFYLFVDVSKLLGQSVGEYKIETAKDVADVLFEKYNVAVVPSDAFGYEDHIRISYATGMRDIVEGVNRIERFVKENF
ncbi:MAG: pyridoxal phosphate-dependent aminotransferase [Firmicutes bacterium]|nr:pyridoxal phosphate-dependent aminotransferase [Bacillota bacterium]